MAKRTTVWTSQDGREWTTEEAAERHDALCRAQQDYDEARNRLFLLLSGQLKTRDGQVVDFGKRARYYTVLFEYGDAIVAEVHLRWNRWDWALDDRDRLTIVLRWQFSGDSKESLIHIPVEDLWVDREQAIGAMIEARRARLDERAGELDEMDRDHSRVRIWG